MSRVTLLAGLTFVCLVIGLLIGRETFLRTGAAVSWTGVFDTIAARWPDVPQMRPGELSGRLAGSDSGRQPVLVDVRRRSEYEISHLPGALHAESPGDIRALAGDVPPGGEMVLYCSVGIRSSEAAARLTRDGYTNVFNLQGSIFQWANEGYPVVSNGQPAHRVHPYDAAWGTLLNPEFHPVKEQ
jgi:rhodanese-related sulfurtransferase